MDIQDTVAAAIKFMKKLNKHITINVLAIHIAILLLIWGGLSTLGAAFVLSIPFVGGIAWVAYQQGKESRGNAKKIYKELSLNAPHSFRG